MDHVIIASNNRTTFRELMSREFSRQNQGAHPEIMEVRADLNSDDRRRIRREIERQGGRVQRASANQCKAMMDAMVENYGVYDLVRFEFEDGEVIEERVGVTHRSDTDDYSVQREAFERLFLSE